MPEITGDLHIRTNEADIVVLFLLTDGQKLLLIPDIICYNWNQVLLVAKAIFKVFVLDLKLPFFQEIETFRNNYFKGFCSIQQLKKKFLKIATNEIGMFLTLFSYYIG